MQQQKDINLSQKVEEPSEQTINLDQSHMVQQGISFESAFTSTLKRIIIFLIIFSITSSLIYFVVSFRGRQLAIEKSLSSFLLQSIKNLQNQVPRKYINIGEISEHLQLPFCIIIDNHNPKVKQKIEISIKSQGYHNYFMVFFNFSKNELITSNQDKKSQGSQKYNSYYELLKLINRRCPKNSVLHFADDYFTVSLKDQNEYLQNYNAWLLYDLYQYQKHDRKFPLLGQLKNKNIKKVRIFSVYKRVFQALHLNDFHNTSFLFLSNQFDPSFIMAGLFQLSRYYSLRINTKQKFFLPFKNRGVLEVDFQQTNQQKIYTRIPYQNMHSLVQNFFRNDLDVLDQNRKLFYSSNKTLTQSILYFWDRASKLNHADMEMALQFEQIVYLPDNHSLNLLQIKRMEDKYQTGKYPNELPLCININSHNNQQNLRYQKVLESVAFQNYSNFHIVFIDDFSTDETLNLTRKFLEQDLKFPRQKLTFVRNMKRKFATYNIINAAFNYCTKDSIQVLVDGDDQIIGRQVFKFINAWYQTKDLWVMYTFFINDKYRQGVGIGFQPSYLQNYFGGRKLIYYFGQLKSFKSVLLRRLSLKQHTDQFGNFFDIMYDNALQYPLFETAGIDHVQSVLQPNYLYFSDYGNNDSSTIFKSLRRIWKHILLSFRSPLKKIEILQEKENHEVRQVLQKSRDIQYKQIKD